jgi:hypothetical protein
MIYHSDKLDAPPSYAYFRFDVSHVFVDKVFDSTLIVDVQAQETLAKIQVHSKILLVTDRRFEFRVQGDM